MKRILQDHSFQLSIILTLIFMGTGVGFLFMGLTNYSWILFVLLPIVLGISIGAMPNGKYTFWGAVFAAVIFLMAMYIPGLSGLLCIIMTLPILIPLIFLGYVVAHLLKKYKALKSTTNLPVLLLPLLPFMVGAPVEYFMHPHQQEIVEVRTEQVYPYTPEQVYDAIKSVDTLVAEKPFLMQFDLPIPVKCVLEKEAVGGLRTCYFKAGSMSNADFGGGTIVEKITQLEKAKLLRMDVIDYNMVGRNWIGFKEAIYYFDKVGKNSCKLTRVTTYTSELTPRFYWEPLEKLGIEQEHAYVLDNLANDLKRNYGQQKGRE
ncbi:polyketide cyclase [Hymenobacter sp. DG25A]|nr:polyketide cyclase [Hymenobacter sp. DG25A]